MSDIEQPPATALAADKAAMEANVSLRAEVDLYRPHDGAAEPPFSITTTTITF